MADTPPSEPARLAALEADIQRHKFSDEEELATSLLNTYRTKIEKRGEIAQAAEGLVTDIRARQSEQPLLDAFLQQFGLSNEEGIALMCLAEALLRVPDRETADDLIADKILSGDWSDHAGQAGSLFVNASTWALMLTGQVISLDAALTLNPQKWFGSLVNRVGTPVIRNAMYGAMRILGREFVLGRTIEEAIERGKDEIGEDGLFSFDMLGEGARDQATADRYFESYAHAIDTVAAANASADIHRTSSVSIKLSALHPRYEYAQWDRVEKELGAKLEQLAQRAADQGIALTVDAEEADRLGLSLRLFEPTLRSSKLHGWNGLGLAVQAYGKRALPTLRWLAALAKETSCKIPVRLVKGAYWDTEIKHAQELGLPDFPVFTRKATTDISYLVCAQEMLSHRDQIYCQFATHNAHTLAAVMSIAGEGGGFEFQRLHGMGELLYDQAVKNFETLPPVRVYAPCGGHEDLLAYLVRRLLENGANSSFVNRFMDEDIPAHEVVQDPADRLTSRKTIRHDLIRQPKDLFKDRKNSKGLDLTSRLILTPVLHALGDLSQKEWRTQGSAAAQNGVAETKITNPANRDDVVGSVVWTPPDGIHEMVDQASANQSAWDATGGAARATILEAAADLLEEHQNIFLSLLIREAGKCLPDAVAEIREAADFCRYYAQQARTHFSAPRDLPGPTGERNQLSLHGRGVFVCISPWNFPLAIFMGQVTAALAAGNAVIAKPAEQTPLIAAEAIRLLIDAGVPEAILHIAPGDGTVGAALTAHPSVAGVAFTGSTDTARKINQSLAMRDGSIVPLIAETGGQNVMVVDSTALLEQVTDDVIQSAFISAGQRCSALRVLYLQNDIADKAIALIRGAMTELRVGDPAKLSTDIGPVIDEDAKTALEVHLTAISKDAISVFKPDPADDLSQGTFVLPHLVEIDSITKLTQENFGPILHVVRFHSNDLDRHLEEVRATGFGLTFGIHSRIESHTHSLFQQQPVGNTYVNRNMVGAVVGVQPFGGQGLSGTGPKAGGPHYLLRFATEKTLTINTMAAGGNADLLRL